MQGMKIFGCTFRVDELPTGETRWDGYNSEYVPITGTFVVFDCGDPVVQDQIRKYVTGVALRFESDITTPRKKGGW